MARQAKKQTERRTARQRQKQTEENRQTTKQTFWQDRQRKGQRETDNQTKTKTDTETEGQSISNLVVLSPVAQYGYIMVRVRARWIDNGKQQVENERNAYRHIERQNEMDAALKRELEKKSTKEKKKGPIYCAGWVISATKVG